MTALRIAVFALGAFCALATFFSAIRTVVLPRAVRARISRAVFLAVRSLFRLRIRRDASYERIDHVMASYAPTALLTLVLVWEGSVLLSYTLMFWALQGDSLREAFITAGSSLLTLGFTHPESFAQVGLAFSAAAIGLVILALLITYLPSLYTAFSRREQMVQLLEVRAGSPPAPLEMFTRAHRIGRMERLGAIWPEWERWFADLEETHTSFPALVFFRSSRPGDSWVTAAGTILDAAALAQSTLDVPNNPDASLCIRAGFLCLRRIAGFFGVPFDPDPRPDDPISIARDEFDDLCDAMAAEGIALKPDRDQAWRDYAGWRVNYDAVLLALAAITLAPVSPWVSDRSGPYSRDLSRSGRIRIRNRS